MPPDSGRTEAAERILSAAKTLFARDGFSAVSIRDIAAASGVSKANIFHHFDSKEALYLETLRRCCNSAAELLAIFATNEQPLDQQLRNFVRQDLKRVLDDPDGTRLLLSAAFDASPTRARSLVDQVFGANFQCFTQLLAAAPADAPNNRPWRPEIDVAAVATLLIAANSFFFAHREVLRQLPGVDFAEHPEHYADMIVDLLLDGIRKETSQ